MNGWITLAFLAAAAGTLLWSLRVSRALWPMVGAALTLGAAGYAMQGSPALGGSAPDRAASQEQSIDPALLEIREQMFGKFQYANTYFFVADALGRSGDHGAAVRALTGGVRSAPGSLPLWTWLGMAFNQHDAGTMSPATQFAFERARSLNPRHPAPWFFQGVAYARAGEFERARRFWARALAVSRPGAAYRAPIAERIAALDRFLIMRARMRAEMGGAPEGP